MLNRQHSCLLAAFVSSAALALTAHAQSFSVAVWGDNSNYQTNLPTGLSNVVALAAGANHTLALTSNGTVVAWGDDRFYQVTLPPGLSGVIGIAASYYHCLAVLTNGTVVGWGDDTSGRRNPPAGLSNFIAVAAGFYHSLALMSDGTVIGWGDNTYGQRSIPAGVRRAIAIAAGEQHSVALFAPLPPVVLSIVLPSGGPARLQFSSSPRLSYPIQASTNPVDWDTLGTATDLGNGSYEFQDAAAGSFKARFYRAASS